MDKKVIFKILVLPLMALGFVRPCFGADLSVVQTFTEKVLDPLRQKISKKIPALRAFISPIPTLNDVSSKDLVELRSVFSTTPPRLAVAVGTENVGTPSFYVAGDLPEEARLNIFIVGVPDTLLNQTSFGYAIAVEIIGGLGKATSSEIKGLREIPRGQYDVYIIESKENPPETLSAIASIATVSPTLKAPTTLPKGARLLYYKSFFLGGKHDLDYETSLKGFHEKLMNQSHEELRDLKQFAYSMEARLNESNTSFRSILSIKKGRATKSIQNSAWEAYDKAWAKFSNQVWIIYSSWTQEFLEKNMFYRDLYDLTRSTEATVDLVHKGRKAIFESGRNILSQNSKLEQVLLNANAAISLLKFRLDEAEKLPPTPGGLPQRPQ